MKKTSTLQGYSHLTEKLLSLEGMEYAGQEAKIGLADGSIALHFPCFLILICFFNVGY